MRHERQGMSERANSTRRIAIDLFAGAGGVTQGLLQAGYDIVGAIENDPVAARSYSANHPSVRLIVKDIRYVTARRFRRELGLQRGELDLLTACPPCQGWSSLGLSSPTDPRNDLISEVFRFIQEFRPRAFVVENVPGLRRDARLARLIHRANHKGYQTKCYQVDAAEFGVPQHRKRLIILGLPDRTCSPPGELAEALPANFDTRRRDSGEVFDAVKGANAASNSLHRARQSTPAVVARLEAIPVGGNRFDLPPDLSLKCHKRIHGRHATAAYGRIRADKPAPTLTTRCTTPACGTFVHPTEHRGITLLEAALLQTFPPTYIFEGGYDQIERQIGNALPVRLAEGLGRIIDKLCSS